VEHACVNLNISFCSELSFWWMVCVEGLLGCRLKFFTASELGRIGTFASASLHGDERMQGPAQHP
jgi:hypothetical protein